VDENTQRLNRVFMALADPTRRDLVARLAGADATVGELAVVGDFEGDKELEGHYWFYDRGIVSRCAPLSEDRTISDLIEMFKRKGWQPIDVEEAFTDSVFRAEPKTVPAGESIVWALAKEKGTISRSLRYPAEDGEYENAKMDKLGL